MTTMPATEAPGSRRPAPAFHQWLSDRAVLADGDKDALRALPSMMRDVPQNGYLVREDAHPDVCAFILSGFAFRQKLAATGGRQILGIVIPGEFTDLQHLFLACADHNVQALTPLTLMELRRQDVRQLVQERPAIAHALWRDTLVEASLAREALLNIGRRDGPTRLAHYLCEFEVRLRAAGLADRGFDLPMTQEQIGDALGLTAVHVNRTLRLLTEEGLIRRAGRLVRIADWGALQRRAEFNPAYLHLAEGRR